MIKHIQSLRDLPIKDRRNILHFSMFVFGLIVFGLWTLTLKQNLQTAETQIELERSAKPFVNFGNQMAGTYNAITNQFSDGQGDQSVIELKSTIENGQR